MAYDLDITTIIKAKLGKLLQVETPLIFYIDS